MAVARSWRDSSNGTGTTSGGPSGTATRASSSTPARSAADFVKLTTTRSHASGPSRCWMSAIARKVASTSRVCGEGRDDARLGDLRAGGRQHARVLPHLHRGQMEPERLHLPPQVLQLAPRQPRSATGRRASAAASRCPSRNSDGAGVGPADAQPGRREPMGRQAQLPSVGCVGQRPSEFGGDLGKLAARPRSSARRSARLGGTSRSDTDSVRAIRRAAASIPRSAWSVWIAIAARVTSAVTAGLPSRSPPTQVPHRRNGANEGGLRPTPFGVEGAVHLAIDRRQGHEDRLVEQGERRAHLIERLGTVPADRLGAPQPGDLLAQPAMDLLLVGGSRGQVLELFEQGADPPQVLDHGATLRLGGVGGQHRRDAQILERGRVHVQGVDRVLHRLARTGATRAGRARAGVPRPGSRAGSSR